MPERLQMARDAGAITINMRDEYVYDRLHETGQPLGLRDFGVRALNSLRLEKGYGGWGREFTQDFANQELARLLGAGQGSPGRTRESLCEAL